MSLSVSVLGVGLYLSLCLVLARWADRRSEPDERHFVTTDDGWTLCLHRFLPRGDSRDKKPLILGHGLMMNSASWELGPEASMIRALCDAGYDIFAAEYRGSRSSQHPSSQTKRQSWSYSIEEHAHSDLPAIIDGVRALTGSDRVHWMGHSMGGIVIYLYGARFGCDRLARVITLASPVIFNKIRGPGPALARLFRKMTPARKVFRARIALACVLPLILFFPVLLRLGVNTSNLGVRSRLTLIRGAVEDISTQLLDWFLIRVPTGGSDSLIDGHAGNVLAKFDAPLLVVAGGSDLLAPPAAVRPAFEHAASTEKRFLLLDGRGEPEGAPTFGHSDIPSSPAAVQHLSPIITEWLRSRSDISEDTDVRITG